MIYILLSLFFFIASIAGFAVSFVIIFTKKNLNQNFFLSLCLFSLAIGSIYSFYLSASVLKEFSNFFIMARSFIFLVAPCSFLYIRNVLLPGKMIRKYDWIHFTPFIACFIYIVFSFSDRYVNQLGGLLNEDTIQMTDYLSVKVNAAFPLIIIITWLGYAFVQTIMILKFDLKSTSKLKRYNDKVINWLRIFNIMIIVLFSTLFVHRFLSSSIINIDFVYNAMVSFMLLFTVSWLYFKPQVLYGLREPVAILRNYSSNPIKVEEVKDSLPILSLLTDEKKIAYLITLEKAFLSKKLFLKKNLVIRDLSEETGIPVHHLSSLINSEYNLHFQDYVNLKRIEYFKDKVNDIDWKHLSLEGMAWGSGFKSRTTCFRAFVKHTGKSPSEYFKFIRISSETRNEFSIK
ncbi:helix-turn-helix domain-containing protein [Flavobacterium hydatis]|uniref:Histidine kinase n=1 Tax=Flavobacterium hydatis TaxID=991 RepID=A0A086ARV4_FLAHY|nr:helix-turn-helix domain-containing protein [Flavobacterium hydatis]KFF19418.1 histidine kinase [Flavobacterium hydatis]OXA96453.1 histidine kinase [Flavobacterium hydatis]